MKHNFPISAIIGQDELVLGILLNIANPKLGGLLIKGVKGTGKSTAVYSIPELMEPIEIHQGCQFNCNPENETEWCNFCKNEADKKIIKLNPQIISVPLSVTEERLLGSVNVEQLLKSGDYQFIPGLLTLAHRQILYLDEVNLMPDHIIDDILDVASTKYNKIQRENFSLEHKSDFLLIGTMNPEEGELRPQILDRFPLSVIMNTVKSPEARKEIIDRNLAFENNPEKFRENFAVETERLKFLIAITKENLGKVKVPEEIYRMIINLCITKNVDGHRADIIIIKTAKTYAALEQKSEVELKHIKFAANLALNHRTRNGGLDKPLSKEEIKEFFDNYEITETEKNVVEKYSVFGKGGLIDFEKK